MEKIRVSKKFTFEAAHALNNYDGKCKNIHGHSYILFVTVIGQIIDNEDNTKNGMIIDFGDLKRIINTEIIDVFDHSLILSSKSVEKFNLENLKNISKIIQVDYQPTCENMLIDFAKRISESLPTNVQLFSVKLHETANSFAEWYASDNFKI